MHLGEDIIVSIGDDRIVLRPSLRAAVQLERAHGLNSLLNAVLDGNASTMAALISSTTGGACTADVILSRMMRAGLLVTVEALKPSLVALVLALLGADPDDENEAKSDGPSRTVAEAQKHLFGIATGAIGWTPAEAWQATPLEILAAWRGRVELLKAIFGSKEEEAPQERPGLDDDAFAASIRARATVKVGKPA
jgi:hypothetical protein